MTSRRAARGDLLKGIAGAVEAGVDWVQIREREMPGAALLAHAEAIATVAREAAARRGGRVTLIVNRFADVAIALGADGIQLGHDAVAPSVARRLLGVEARIGISAHEPDEIRDAHPEVSHAQLAPVFRPLSKAASRPPLGIEALRAAAGHRVPVLAQGGITPENARALVRAGAAGVAVTGAILGAPDPADAARKLRDALDRDSD